MTGKVPNGNVWRIVQILIGAGLGAGSIVGGLWYMISLTIESQHLKEQLAAQIVLQEKTQADVATNKSAIERFSRDLNEIETQFCAMDDLRNQIHAQDLRNYAVLYEKVFNQPYPITNPFYARVCNRQTGK